MMVTTHALVGAALAAVVSVVAPELAPFALVGGVAGGIFPDLDLYQYHRRTLHFPSYYTMVAAVTVVIAVLVTGPVTVGVATFMVAAAIHARMDRYGGGLELRPWQGTSNRAVYDHRRGRWRQPLRWVRYDGAPEDLLVATVVAMPAIAVFDGFIRWGIVAVLGISVGYVLIRKRLPDLAILLAGYVPKPFDARIPNRYLQ